jgi:hypothetical protein
MVDESLQRGAWIASTKKHLDRHQCTPEVYEFRATEIAGKAGNLLALFQADQKERITPQALDAYFTSAKIRPAERDFILDKLQKDERIEICRTTRGKLEGIDIYTFSRDQVLKSTSRIFDASDPTLREQASIIALETVCQLPHTQSEIVSNLADAGFEDEDAVSADRSK